MSYVGEQHDLQFGDSIKHSEDQLPPKFASIEEWQKERQLRDENIRKALANNACHLLKVEAVQPVVHPTAGKGLTDGADTFGHLIRMQSGHQRI